MKKGEIFMKLLAIENNKGTYSIDGINFIEIEKISKDDILKLLEEINSFEEDQYYIAMQKYQNKE